MTVEKLMAAFEHIAATDSREEVYSDDGVYQGVLITYTNPVHPDMKTVFHPYIPLQMVDYASLDVVSFSTRYGKITPKI